MDVEMKLVATDGFQGNPPHVECAKLHPFFTMDSKMRVSSVAGKRRPQGSTGNSQGSTECVNVHPMLAEQPRQAVTMDRKRSDIDIAELSATLKETLNVGQHEANGDQPLPCKEEDKIPEAVVDPTIRFEPTKGPMTEIYFDLETNGLGRDVDIIQIAAVAGGKTFNVYIKPASGYISRDASRATRLSFFKGRLLYKRKVVPTVPQREAFKQFVHFVCSWRNPLLIGHNIRAFDCRVLYQSFKPYPHFWDELTSSLVGFLDTLTLFKAIHPEMKSHTQSSLVKTLTGQKYDAHNALEDSRALCSLLRKEKVDQSITLKYVFPAKYLEYLSNAKDNEDTLAILIADGSISQAMCAKMGKSGLRYAHLETAYVKEGLVGLERLLTQENSLGEPRVTKSRKIINNLAQYFNDKISG